MEHIPRNEENVVGPYPARCGASFSALLKPLAIYVRWNEPNFFGAQAKLKLQESSLDKPEPMKNTIEPASNLSFSIKN